MNPFVLILITGLCLSILIVAAPFILAFLTFLARSLNNQAGETLIQKKKKVLDQQMIINEARIARENNAVLIQDITIEEKIARAKITALHLEDLLRRRGVQDFTPIDYPDALPASSEPGSEPIQESPRIVSSSQEKGRSRKR